MSIKLHFLLFLKCNQPYNCNAVAFYWDSIVILDLIWSKLTIVIKYNQLVTTLLHKTVNSSHDYRL